ncbi:DNA-binding response regulator [bacterium D16-51]|nr:DNA-binding response regulator [bacterium D16-59]RKI60447.1 DNA-binding response regulator [bacterium D16-51]
MARILVVEDDRDLRNGVVHALENEGYEVETAGSLWELESVPVSSVDAVFLDITLPDGSSRDYLEKLRKVSGVPCIFLTAHNTEQDMIKGFDAGADDYITKPFSVPLLLRRLKAVLNRGKRESDKYCVRGLVYDFREKTLAREGEFVPLSKTETRLLEVFLQNRNQVLTTEILLGKIWDIDGNFVDKNTLSVTVTRLRAKIEEDRKHPKWIKNVFGIGYKWSDRDEE